MEREELIRSTLRTRPVWQRYSIDRGGWTGKKERESCWGMSVMRALTDPLRLDWILDRHQQHQRGKRATNRCSVADELATNTSATWFACPTGASTPVGIGQCVVRVRQCSGCRVVCTANNRGESEEGEGAMLVKWHAMRITPPSIALIW